MVRWHRGLAVAAVVALVLVAPPPAKAQARTWTVVAGGLTRDGSVWSNAFHPREVDVTVGDVVEWQFAGFHNVAFAGGGKLPPLVVMEDKSAYLNPQVAFPVGSAEYDGQGYRNSGVPPEDLRVWASRQHRYRLRFVKPGTYVYTCIVHGPAMSGVVRVHPQGTRLPRDPAAVLRQGLEEQQATLQAGQRALARLRPEARGGSVRVPVVGDGQRGYSLMRFTRTPLVVRRGTTVTWEIHDPFEIHTVTFVGTEKVPPFVIPQMQAGGPPKLLLNPKVAAPTPHRDYAGSGYVNSGILVPLGAPGPRTYSLRFTRSGTYTYWCPVHALVGMKGVVVVR
ncbi:MAG: plastocyanin/azurin family copper-binding protein [Armatimonadota bacterium]|nr:plastocyanin/azurin family copper-binding protein [Armatimonadota bacterium]MDR7441232.1 plastocyanin/azurin family copper-binding protein [Armatimonadota bacterium]